MFRQTFNESAYIGSMAYECNHSVIWVVFIPIRLFATLSVDYLSTLLVSCESVCEVSLKLKSRGCAMVDFCPVELSD